MAKYILSNPAPKQHICNVTESDKPNCKLHQYAATKLFAIRFLPAPVHSNHWGTTLAMYDVRKLATRRQLRGNLGF